MASANEKLVVDYLEAIKVGERDKAYACFAEDATWKTPPSLPWPGFFKGRRAIFHEYFAVDEGLFSTGVASYDLENTCVISTGPYVVVEMTHRSTGLNGKKYETDHCVVFEVRDGLIQAAREYVDTLYLKEQMIDADAEAG